MSKKKRNVSPEQRKAASDRMKKMHADKKQAKMDALNEAPKVDEVVEELDEVVEPVASTKIPSKIKSKKGRTPWKPAHLLTVRGKTDGYRYRWVTNTDQNRAKKQEEGWEDVKSTNGLSGEHERPENTIDGGPMCSDTVEYRESILMALPEELAQERDEYHKQKVRDQSHEKLHEELKSKTKELGGAAAPKLHGAITFD